MFVVSRRVSWVVMRKEQPSIAGGAERGATAPRVGKSDAPNQRVPPLSPSGEKMGETRRLTPELKAILERQREKVKSDQARRVRLLELARSCDESGRLAKLGDTRNAGGGVSCQLTMKKARKKAMKAMKK